MYENIVQKDKNKFLILFKSIEHSQTQSFCNFVPNVVGSSFLPFKKKIQYKYTVFEWIVTNAELLNLIQVYRALMDAVVLDWTISLADKDRMKTCVVTYLAQEAKESTTIDPFMPKTRTFLLENLRPNHVSSSMTSVVEYQLKVG